MKRTELWNKDFKYKVWFKPAGTVCGHVSAVQGGRYQDTNIHLEFISQPFSAGWAAPLAAGSTKCSSLSFSTTFQFGELGKQ